MESADHVLQILKIFEAASGQQINVDKSSVFFSKNTSSLLKTELCQRLNFHEANDHSLYLGLPNIIGRNKSSIFGYLKEKLQNRLQDWGNKILSKDGKEVSLKTVAQTLPNYAIGVFLLPLNLCQDLEKLMCKFWWRMDSKKERGIRCLTLQGQMVSSLMDDSGNWDINLILDVFDNRDANLILSIPLDTRVQDSWYWRQEKLGCYSSTQQTQPNSGFWRKLWNPKIPPKVKNFLWRASTNCLPTKDLLRSKRVQVINLCPTFFFLT
ncbi:hypothetical protein DCAR_0416000 [Daucus carota subsp. sativus]|uniref:Reverse transcriptase zinc-binding domain-containing protein n=1 Tax=Daucus carota subsp. sativus TaxID=79200 RepID=A0AAF0WVV6_DAUCS|nr:hypothetical protein DCAR_0416000 [Daucus carota subsp. sativus]